jgi:hypothetical protein
MSTDADFTLEELWAEGIDGLKDEGTSPGTTYEVAPGLVGTMPWPTLADREEVQEIREDLTDLFREDATAEQFEALGRAVDGEGINEEDNPIREGVTAAEFERTTSRVNCRQAALLLDFEEEVEAHDIVPDMAAVISTHFTRLRAGSSGQATS